MRTVKNIFFKMELEGQGIVNFDSDEQRFIHNSSTKSHLKYSKKNVMYSKKNFYRGDDGDTYFKIKISKDCLRYNMYGETQTPKIGHNKDILYSYIASEMGLMRGFMVTKKDDETFNRKGSLIMHDAEQTNNAIPVLETFSRSGEKINKEDADDASDTSFYKKETVGEMTYATKGSISLNRTMFLSCDTILGRYGFNPDDFENYVEKFLKLRIPKFNSKLNYYKIAKSSIPIPEYGLLLSHDNVKFLVKQTLLRLLDLQIERNGGYANTSGLKIKLVYNCTKDTYKNEEGWINIDTEEDIENLDFEIHDFYEKCDDNDLNNLKTMQENFERSRIEARDKKKEKKNKDNKDELSNS